MNSKPEGVEIPTDVWESPQEIIIIVSLGGVEKSSLKVALKNQIITIEGVRKKPELGEKFKPILQECFWGSFFKQITLPLNVYFDKIVVQLSSDNILKIIVPKINIPNEKELDIQFI